MKTLIIKKLEEYQQTIYKSKLQKFASRQVPHVVNDVIISMIIGLQNIVNKKDKFCVLEISNRTDGKLIDSETMYKFLQKHINIIENEYEIKELDYFNKFIKKFKEEIILEFGE
ncbi:MAG: hypothetical protein HN704_02140 [Bacteroidetes bacterium]|jgi:hypothetical protein|nr:hypothetical protein [Bacteroidota bacterium]MBT6834941.1 hypothetical protein [Bacteroidota bacterium]MBT7141973.1 hypothetical protein [Bacteroidota bacterium]MBT7490386.1 hypothetical protein [Bacteroidota bacterium]